MVTERPQAGAKSDMTSARLRYPADDTYLDEDNFDFGLTAEQKLERLLLYNIEGDNYAWGRMARLLCEDEYNKAYESTSGDFIALDLFSSVPVFPQIMRERYRDRCYGKAQNIVGQTLHLLQSRQHHLREELRIPAADDLTEEQRKLLRTDVSPRESKARRLMQTAVADLLYNPPTLPDPPYGINTDIQQLTDVLLSYFKSSVIMFGRKHEGIEIEGKGQWQTIIRQAGTRTLERELQDLFNPSGAEGEISPEVENFMRDLATSFAKQAIPDMRRHFVISVDREDPKMLIRNGEKCFPEEFKDTDFYDRVKDLTGNKHIQADATMLPVKPGSVSFISAIEGLPFYAHGMPLVEELHYRKTTETENGERNIYWRSQQGHLPFARDIADALAPGGRAVIFPNHIRHSDSQDRENLEKVEEYWRKRGLKVAKKTYTRVELMDEMRFREKILTYRSPVFTDFRRTKFTLLVAEKPQLQNVT